jgi:hypothetical protein
MSLPKDALYVIRPVGMDGPVKIGRSMSPHARLAAMMPCSPYRLEIAVVMDEWGQYETRFHALLERHHSHHEWFVSHEAVSAVIDALRDGTFDLSTLPAGKRLIRYKKPVVNSEARAARKAAKRVREEERRIEWAKIERERAIQAKERALMRVYRKHGILAMMGNSA